MSTLSDQLLVVTIVAYLAAMVGYAAEQAFATRTVAGRAREPVPAGAPPEAPHPPAEAPAPQRLARIALGALLLAAAAHLATAVTRGLAAERLVWGNMYEWILTATLAAVATWVGVGLRYPAVRQLGLYLTLVNAVLLGAAGLVYTPVQPLVAALDSAWFIIHVAAATTAAGVFLVGFVTAVMQLIRAGHDRGKRRFPYQLGAHLPAADAVERLTFRLHAFAFPIWTFAVIAGAIWAEQAWGRYWAWDPKEVWAFISWVVYAGYLHARATPSVKPTTAAWLAIIGWLTILMNLFGVNLFITSLHSYAGA